MAEICESIDCEYPVGAACAVTVGVSITSSDGDSVWGLVETVGEIKDVIGADELSAVGLAVAMTTVSSGV